MALRSEQGLRVQKLKRAYRVCMGMPKTREVAEFLELFWQVFNDYGGTRCGAG